MPNNINGNILLYWLFQIYLANSKSDKIKGVHPRCDSNLNCEKVCVDCTNGDVIELVVNDEDNSVYATFIMKQKETDANKLIKGRMIYSINKWPTELKSAQFSSYIAKLISVVKDVQATYEDGSIVLLCAFSSGSEN